MNEKDVRIVNAKELLIVPLFPDGPREQPESCYLNGRDPFLLRNTFCPRYEILEKLSAFLSKRRI